MTSTFVAASMMVLMMVSIKLYSFRYIRAEYYKLAGYDKLQEKM